MPRKLPWLTGQTSTAKLAPTPIVRKRHRLPSPVRSKRSPGSSRNEYGSTRTPSTSPPPQIPTQAAMTRADAVYVMVEDEFYETAQTFTQHMHYEEYRRLKDLAARKTGETVRAIERPTVGQKINLEKKIGKEQAEARKISADTVLGKGKGQNKVHIKTEESGTDEEEEIAIGDRNLASLMQGTGAGGRKFHKQNMTAVIGNAKSNTRAAAGFGKQDSVPASRARGISYVIKSHNATQRVTNQPKTEEHNEDEVKVKMEDESQDEIEDEDDLDAPIKSLQPRHIKKPSLSTHNATTLQPPPMRDKHPPDPPLRLASKKDPADYLGPSRVEMKFERDSKPLEFEDMPVPRTAISSFTKRMAAKEKSRAEKEKNPSIQRDEIPIFLT